MDITTATWSASRFYSIRKWETTLIGHHLPVFLLLLVALGSSFFHTVSGSSAISSKIEISGHPGSPVNYAIDLEKASEDDWHNVNGRWEGRYRIPIKRSITLEHLNKNHQLLENALRQNSFGNKGRLIESRTPEERTILSHQSQARSSQDGRLWRTADKNVPKSQIPEKNLAFIKESKSFTKFSFENFLRTTPITTTTDGTTLKSTTPVDRLEIDHNSGQIKGYKNIPRNAEGSNGVLDTIRRYKEYTFSPDPAHLSSNLLRNVLHNRRKLITPAGVLLPTPVPFINLRVASLPNNTFSVPPEAGFTFGPLYARSGSSLTNDSEDYISPGKTFLNTEYPALGINKSDIERAGSAQITPDKPLKTTTDRKIFILTPESKYDNVNFERSTESSIAAVRNLNRLTTAATSIRTPGLWAKYGETSNTSIESEISRNTPTHSTTPTTHSTTPTTHSTTPTTLQSITPTTLQSITPTTLQSITPTTLQSIPTTTLQSITPTTLQSITQTTTHSTTTPTTTTNSTTPTTTTTHSTTPTAHSTTATSNSTTSSTSNSTTSSTSNSTTSSTSLVRSTETVTGLPSSVVATQQFLTKTSQAVVSSEPSTGGPSVTEQIKVEPIVTAGAGDPTAAFVFLSLGLVTILIGIFFIFKIYKERVRNENVRPYSSRRVSEA